MKLVIDNVSKNFIDPQGKQLSVTILSLLQVVQAAANRLCSILQQGCCHQAMGVFISQI